MGFSYLELLRNRPQPGAYDLGDGPARATVDWRKLGAQAYKEE